MTTAREWGPTPLGYRRLKNGALDSTPWPDDPDSIKTLGWGVIDWAESNLIHHLDGTPWRYTADQKRYLVLWYAVDDEGRWLYRSGVLRRAKGSGKDPFGATKVLAELMGPTKFSHFDELGQPVGIPHRKSLVLISANSEDQAKELLSVANELPSPELVRRERYQGGIIRASASRGRRIKLLTNSERSNEGDPATAIFLNESHHMTHSSGGQRTAAVARRNAGKSPGGLCRVQELTNAHEEGGGSVAEDTYLAWQNQVAGKTRNRDILYSSIEADPSLSFTNHDDIDLIINQAYIYSPWVSKERILSEIDDTRTTVADSIRFYANGLAATESSWIEPQNFRALARPDIVVRDGEEIALALDCSKSEDATTLSAVRISDGHVMALGLWQRPRGDRGRGWIAPREEVDIAVRAAFARYTVVWFGADPSPARDDETEQSYWMPLLDTWHRDLGKNLPIWACSSHSVLFDMRLSVPGGRERLRLFTEAAMETAHAIDEDKTLTHDGDPAQQLHVQHARRRPNNYGIGLGKATRDSKDKVDYAVTMVMARMGRKAYLNSSKKSRPEKKRGVWAY